MSTFFQTFTGGIAETNGYCLATASGHILIDAPEGITEWLSEQNIRPSHLLLTHQHFDHVMDVGKLQAQGVKVLAFAAHSTELTLENMSRSWGLPLVETYIVDELFDLTKPLVIDDLHFTLQHIPGHSPDSVTFYLADKATVFSGDTLFRQSIGRTDLPGHGNHDLLIAGIRSKLLTLPGNTQVFPGHGGGTTIAQETLRNPYL